MATSLESASPVPLNKGSPLFSPSSDKCFWSTLRNRIDTLIENRKPVDHSITTEMNSGAMEQARRLKDDSMLLLRGFDSVAHSLSQLSNNLENALQGAKILAKPPTLTEILHAKLEKARTEESPSEEEKKDEQQDEEDKETDKRGFKRKLDLEESNDENTEGEEASNKAKENGPNQMEKIKKAKNLAISMATKAATMARELKSIRSDLAFMQERCALLEEENKKLRVDGESEGMRRDDDDLVRLQLETLLAEKSRLANENANLTRENQCLHQLVEYHQLTSQDLSASYENLLRGMCLDFSSPQGLDDGCSDASFKTPNGGEDVLGLSKSLDDFFDEVKE